MSDDLLVDTPLQKNVKLRPTDGEPLSNPTWYRQAFGQIVFPVLGQTHLTQREFEGGCQHICSMT